MKPDRRTTFAVVIFVTLLIRFLFAGQVCWPALGDSNYYEDVARALARGEGLVSQCIWNFLRPPDTVPHPACGYWGPAVPVLLGAAYAILGVTAVAGRIVMIGLACILAWLGLELARRMLGCEKLTLVAGLLLALHFRLAYFSVTPDTPIPFAVFVNACLLPLGLAVAGWKAGYLVAIPGAVAAQLTRADGILLPVLVVAFAARGAWRREIGWGRLAAVVVLWATLWGPWLARNHAVFGTAFPAPTVESLSLRYYDEIHLYRTAPSPKTYLAQGLARIAHLKWKGLAHNLQIAWSGESRAVMVLFLCALPRLCRMPLAWPFLAYAFLLLGAFSFAFDRQTQHGSFFHSLPALYPFIVAGSLIGLQAVLDRLPDRELVRVLRRVMPWVLVGWMALFSVLALVMPEGVGGMSRELGMVRGVLHGWRDRQGEAFRRMRFMSNFPLELLGSLNAPVVMTPLDDNEALFEVADRWKLTHAVLFDEGTGIRWRWHPSEIRHRGRRWRCIARWALEAPVLEFSGVAIFRLEGDEED